MNHHEWIGSPSDHWKASSMMSSILFAFGFEGFLLLDTRHLLGGWSLTSFCSESIWWYNLFGPLLRRGGMCVSLVFSHRMAWKWVLRLKQNWKQLATMLFVYICYLSNPTPLDLTFSFSELILAIGGRKPPTRVVCLRWLADSRSGGTWRRKYWLASNFLKVTADGWGPCWARSKLRWAVFIPIHQPHVVAGGQRAQGNGGTAGGTKVNMLPAKHFNQWIQHKALTSIGHSRNKKGHALSCLRSLLLI